MVITSEDVCPVTISMYGSGLVPLFLGAPGINKTQGIQEAARKLGVNVTTFILSNTVPSEISGIRMPDNETKKLEVFDDKRMANLKDGDILFFDEILEAPPMIWSAILTLLQDRVMASGRKLPDVMIVAASNPVASPAIIPPSVRDRFLFINVNFDWAAWKSWLKRTHDIDVCTSLVNRIQKDSNTYNILTPRKATKLLLWLRDVSRDPEQFILAKRVIANAFDEALVDILEEIVNNKSFNQQIREAILDVNDVELPEDFNDWTASAVLEYLQAMDKWPEIERALATTMKE